MKNNYRSEFNTRQQMLKDSYEIYYYSDSHFQSVSPHRHDYYEFYFPASGSIDMEISGRKTPLSEHDAVLVPPGTVHRAVNENGEQSYSRYVFWISADYYRQLAESTAGISYAVTGRKEEAVYPPLQRKRIFPDPVEDPASDRGREFFPLCQGRLHLIMHQ